MHLSLFKASLTRETVDNKQQTTNMSSAARRASGLVARLAARAGASAVENAQRSRVTQLTAIASKSLLGSFGSSSFGAQTVARFSSDAIDFPAYV